MRSLLGSRKVVYIVLICCIVLALAISTVGLALAQEPSITVTPDSVAQTNWPTTVKCADFKPEESVLILLVGAVKGEDFIWLGTQCDKNGAIEIKCGKGEEGTIGFIPQAIEPGTYTVKAIGTMGSEATAKLTVTTAPTPMPKPAATPTPAPAATPAAVPKAGTPLPIGWLALAAAAFVAIGFAFRLRK